MTVTPSSAAAFWAPSFKVTQCWSMESMVISAIFTSPDAPAGAAAAVVSVVPLSAGAAALSAGLLPPQPVMVAANSAAQLTNASSFFFIKISSFFCSRDPAVLRVCLRWAFFLRIMKCMSAPMQGVHDLSMAIRVLWPESTVPSPAFWIRPCRTLSVRRRPGPYRYDLHPDTCLEHALCKAGAKIAGVLSGEQPMPL